MKNIFKVAFLGLLVFSFLVYFTIPKKFEEQELSFENFPKYFEVVAKNQYTKKEDFFTFDKKLNLVVLNHDALAVFKDLGKYTNQDDIVLIANISNTPWFIKQIAVNGELEEMYKTSKIPLINDSDGSFIKALNLNDNSQNTYFVYTLFEDENIKRNFSNKVKKGALQEGINEEEKKEILENFLKSLK